MKKLLLALIVFGMFVGNAMAAESDTANVSLDIKQYSEVTVDDVLMSDVVNGGDTSTGTVNYTTWANFTGAATLEFAKGTNFGDDWTFELGATSIPVTPTAAEVSGSTDLTISGIDMADDADLDYTAVGTLTITLATSN